MTASLHRLGTGRAAGLYYTNDSAREARPDRRDEYYLSESGGRWWSTGESVVRHGTAIDVRSFRDLCAGLDPRTGQSLVRGAGEGHWAGVDLTITSGKSVSVLWAAGDESQRAAIEGAHRQAIERALSFVADEGLVVVRTGAGGVNHHRPSDLMFGLFDHYTTREGDPNIHTHCVMMNVAGAPPRAGSGRYKARHLTIEPDGLFKWTRVVGAAYRSEMAAALRERFDLTYRPAGQGQWEIEGVAQELLVAFSKRSAQIDARVGPDATPAQREIAALATRRGKDEVRTGTELEALWHDELASAGLDPWHDALAAGRVQDHPHPVVLDERDRLFDPPEIEGTSPVRAAASAGFRHENVLTRKDLLQGALERAGLQGIGVDQMLTELSGLEANKTLVPLLEAHGLPACWTTPAIAVSEAALLRAASRLDEGIWIEPEAVEAAIARAPHLSEEQREAVRHAANWDGVALLEAGAGTGKTTTTSAVVDSARASGLQVLGLAPSWVAADELARASGIEAVAIARWRQDRDAGRGAPLHARSLVLLDEAGMVSTRDLEAVLTAAHEARAKVLLIGDRRQLPSVGGASALRAVADVVERSAVLVEVRRQEVEWQRAASILMARGDAEAGLRAYAARDRVELVSGVHAAQARAIARWTELRAGNGEDVAIVTRRNRDAAMLNRMAREVLRGEGRLGPDIVDLPALDRDDNRVELSLAVGDQLRFGESLSHLGVRNGNRATVEAVTLSEHGEFRVRLRLEDGRVLDEPWARLAREPLFRRKPAPPRIVPAYAGTAYSVQGRSMAATVVSVTTATDAREIYVALTRHKTDVRVVVERDRLEARCRLRQADRRQAPTTTAVLEALFTEARQYREKRNVADFVADRVAFRADGRLRLHEVAPVPDVARASRAARALREALQTFARDRLIVPAWRLIDEHGRRLLRPIPDRVRALVRKLGEHLSVTRRPERPQERDISWER